MRISDWSSDVCSSDLGPRGEIFQQAPRRAAGGILLRHLAKTLPESLAAAPLRQREKLVLVEPDQRALQHAGKAEIVFRQQPPAAERPERWDGRRVGKECVRTFVSRWWRCK